MIGGEKAAFGDDKFQHVRSHLGARRGQGKIEVRGPTGGEKMDNVLCGEIEHGGKPSGR